MNQILSDQPKTSFPRSACPITNTLDIMGDKWTLLIVRDLILGKHLYIEMMQSPEGIASNILANRLQRLEQEEFINKRAYQSKPTRYEYHLTEKGRDLLPVLEVIAKWGIKHIPGAIIFTENKNDKF